MKSFFTNSLYFSVVFFILLGIDIVVKLTANDFPYRYISKSLLISSLIIYFMYNSSTSSRKNFNYMLIALCSFLVGDIVLINTFSGLMYIIGMIFFVIGKLFYAIRFSNTRDFKISRLLPFLFLCFIYVLWMMNLIYDNLGALFVPTLIYFFAAIIVLQMAFLRKNDVNNLSYYLVFIGVLVSIVSDSITGISSFYFPELPYHKLAIMLFYGLSQYLIVLGISKEIKLPEDELLDSNRSNDSSSTIETM